MRLLLYLPSVAAVMTVAPDMKPLPAPFRARWAELAAGGNVEWGSLP